MSVPSSFKKGEGGPRHFQSREIGENARPGLSSGEAERPLRVGGIDYLNALPLTLYLPLEGKPPLDLSNYPPSVLADKLRSGELEIALVPAVEYLARDDYRILPEICISSYGEVRSIRFFHRRPLRDVRAVGLDRSSRTSALLIQLFFRQLWHSSPSFTDLPPEALEAILRRGSASSMEGEDGQAASLDALLLIGDVALSAPSSPGWECLDLGMEWTRWTGLPFVYAFWVWKGGPCPAGLVRRFQEGKEHGQARIDDIVRRVSLPAGMDATSGRHYLSRVIQYDFGPAQMEGCLEFFARAFESGLVPRPPRPLAFLREENRVGLTASPPGFMAS